MPDHHQRSETGRGFSLIEMMAAVAILGIGVVGLMHGLSGTMEARRRVEERAVATDLLRMKMAEFATTEQPIDNMTGGFDAPFERFTWRIQAIQTSHAGLLRLHTEISWPGRRTPRTIYAETLVPQR